MRGWSNFQTDLGEFLEILPASQRTSEMWYRGTADAVYQNLDIILTHQPRFVLVLGGDHIYKMDHGQMLAAHDEYQADMSVACLEVPVEEAAGAFGVMQVDSSNRIIGFVEKPQNPRPIPGQPGICLASMGNYLFNTDFLIEQLIKDADSSGSKQDFGGDIIPAAISRYRALAHPFRDRVTGGGGGGGRAYWRDVGTIDTYWQANMELLDVQPELNLYDDDWTVLTHQAQQAPAKFIFDDDDRRGMAVDSMVSGGCVISGSHLRRSLLFSSVEVHSYATIEDTVVLPDVDIARNCRIRREIIDRGCAIEPNTTIGYDSEKDRARGFRLTASGIVLVTPDMLGQPIHTHR